MASLRSAFPPSRAHHAPLLRARDSIGAGGPLAVFLTMPLVIVLFALPQAIVTAEYVLSMNQIIF